MARKILLADDSVTAQNMGRKILADAGYEVITVNNGSAALKKIAEHKPDLIVLDVYMPGYSGLEVCQRLKDAQDTARIPVLLTVGKLEPFKPEEAKRVRAEGFIVKPFEASELLSALSKLEDKIVPRGESSKQGRFARAIASVEDAGRDTSEGGEEDSGWKNRISFPSKKKAKDKDEEELERAEERALYNQVNRDLRTVPQEEAAQKIESASNPGTPDISALAAALPKDSLPKDVTLEEIAAIAAAAAQVQAATNGAFTPLVQEPPSPAIQKTDEKIELPIASIVEVKPAEQIAVKEEAPASATFADVTDANQHEEKPAVEVAKEEPKPVEAVAPFANADIRNEDSRTSEPAAPTPIAIAAAAAASVGLSGSRWMAVPVTTDAAEAATSLDQEMQKAYADFVAGEAKAVSPSVPEIPAITSSVALSPELDAPTPAPLTSASSEEIAPVPPAVIEPSPKTTTHEESELGQALSAVANAPVEIVQPPASESAPVAEVTPAAPVPMPEVISSSAPADAASPSEAEVQKIEEPPPVSEATAEPVAQKEEPLAAAQDVPANSGSEITDARAQTVAAVSAAIEEPARHEPVAGGTRSMADKRDSELADSTAAAWASWRQIRSDEPRTAETSKSRRKDDDDDDEPAPPPAQAAMAVAAGAEKRPEEAAQASDPRAIASIVDSVMAELRPRIVEEISRKLGEKK